MELTFLTDLGQSFSIEIDPNMELENVMALLEAEVISLSCFVRLFSCANLDSPASPLANRTLALSNAS